MKIALITLHRVINYGSFLQTYATQKTIEKLGHESLIIDYYPKRYTIGARLSKIDTREETKNRNFLTRFIIKSVLLSSYIFVYPSFHRHQKKTYKMTKKTYRKSMKNLRKELLQLKMINVFEYIFFVFSQTILIMLPLKLKEKVYSILFREKAK